jgi:hypothetical protein
LNETIDWLLNGPAWVEYRTRIDLLEQAEDSPEVIRSRQAMLEHPQVKSMVDELTGWSGHALKRHNDAALHLHKLVFLADIGVKATDPGMEPVVDSILSHQSEEGAFQVFGNTYQKGGGGQDKWIWMLCDAPLVLYSLLRMGVSVDDRLQEAIDHLTGYGRENGWPCAISPEVGRTRGPGKKEDPCPYATLIALKALDELPQWQESSEVKNGIDTMLTLWEQRKERRPFLFAMGTDFRKLKAPLIWYDILHVLDILTLSPQAIEDPRLKEMLDVILEKGDTQKRFTPESIWQAWSEWDFGQKQEPSTWITFLVHRILKRAGISIE